MAKKRIAIVGGGIGGLGSVSALKDVGIDSVCFEKTDSFGGTWYYREESLVGTASVMATTVANNNKELGAVSTYPPPKEFSTFMRHTEILKYAKMFMKDKDCEKHFRFNSEVILVKKADDYDETGRFLVSVKDTVTKEVTVELFDGVIIANGHFAYPKMATYRGQEKFRGTIMHTHNLKRADAFKGKNVLVIGTGCSGLDAAEIASSVAKNVYLSSRSGFIALSRQGPNGYPLDSTLMRRYLASMMEILPLSASNWYIETFYADTKFDQHLYYVKPKHRVLSRDPVLSDAIASKLLSGSVVLKADVKYLTENGAVFEGENSVTEIDSIVMATGYDFKYPFLEEELLQIEEGRINLYKCMYPVQLPHGTLAFIGFVNPFGPGVPIGEMQCRYAAHVLSGKGKLPSRQRMLEDVIKRHERNSKRYEPSSIMSNRVDFLPYMDDLASDIGCKPNLLKYLFTDFPLFLRLLFGPILPYHYRLDGPGKWEGARAAIFTSNERLLYPLVKENNIPRKGVMQLILEFIGNLFPRYIYNF